MAIAGTADSPRSLRVRIADLHLRWRRIAALAAVLLLAVTVIAPLRHAVSRVLGNVIVFVLSPIAPDVADFSQAPGTARLVASDGKVIGDFGGEGKRSGPPTPLADVPEMVRNSVLAAEDKDFYEHPGIDLEAMTRAAWSTVRGNTQGGSTITQQLAKLNYTAGERTVFRKTRELLYASKLEKKYSKDELLERYLNQVYFGEGAYGISAAATTFFGTSVDKLTPSQAATLAGKIRAPEYLDPRTRVRDVTRRRNQVLVNMQRAGWLSDADYKAAVAEPLTIAAPSPAARAGRAPHFVAFVEREAKTLTALGGSPDARLSQLYTGGFTIETTLDNKVYDATVASVQKRLGEAGDPVTAVATVQPGDGAIRSLFGGLDFASTQFDMSSRGGRQAGSAFKPFVYMAALRDGIDPRSTFDGTSGRDLPCYGKVDNYAGEDHSGAINLDNALVQSVNVVFVDVGCQVGTRKVIDVAKDIGIPDDATTEQGAVFLGGLDGEGVNALQMASAYAAFAAKGVYAEPYAIARIKDAGGRVVYEHKAKTRRPFGEMEVGVINRPLQGVVKNGTGTAAAIGRPVAGKTGTTQNNVDAWFTGYTPDLATSVWVGYPQPKPMTKVHGRAVTGGSFPAAIFADVMRVAQQGRPVRAIPTASPDGLGLKLLRGGPTVPVDSTTSTTDTTLLEGEIVIPEPTTSTSTPSPRRTTTTSSPPRATTTTDVKPEKPKSEEAESTPSTTAAP